MRRTTVILLFLACLSCWERQEHDILPPRIPNYTLSGYTVDRDDSLLVIPHAPISLIAVELLYEVTFDPVFTSSDTSGYYQIDTVYPGNYVLTCGRDGYTVLNEKITVDHADTPRDLLLPKPLVAETRYSLAPGDLDGPNPRLAWTEDGTFLLFGEETTSMGTYTIYRPVIYICLIQDGSPVVVGAYSNPMPGATGMAVAEARSYLFNATRLMVLSYINGYKISDQILDRPLDGLTWTGSAFWTTSGHFLQNRGNDLNTVDRSYETEAGQLGSLTHNGEYFWTYDMENALILKLDTEGAILAGYRPIEGETDSWINVQDMDFDDEGRLWASVEGVLYAFMPVDTAAAPAHIAKTDACAEQLTGNE